jgi:hypothetical protein
MKRLTKTLLGNGADEGRHDGNALKVASSGGHELNRLSNNTQGGYYGNEGSYPNVLFGQHLQIDESYRSITV